MTTIPFRDTDLFISKGQRHHNDKEYTIKKTGERWQALLTFLESAAENSNHFPEIAEITGQVMEIRIQLKDQGF